jgi:iron-sulfur cluster assembly protein
MLYISDKAKGKVESIRSTKEHGEEFFIRVSVVGGGCSGLSYDLNFDSEPQVNDQVFEDKGVRIVTDLKSFLYLCDTTLDFSDGFEGKGFHFVNPNASRECACGESFGV